METRFLTIKEEYYKYEKEKKKNKKKLEWTLECHTEIGGISVNSSFSLYTDK